MRVTQGYEWLNGKSTQNVKAPQFVETEYPERLSLWWTSGRLNQVKHYRKKAGSDYWSSPSHIRASGKQMHPTSKNNNPQKAGSRK